MRKDVAEDIRQIFNAKDVNKAQQMLDETVRKYEITAPKLASWLEHNIPEGFAVMKYHSNIRRLIGTTKMM